MTRRQIRIAPRLVFLLPVATLGIAMLLAGAARTPAAWQGQSIPDDLLGGLPMMAISLVPLGACALIAWVIARRLLPNRSLLATRQRSGTRLQIRTLWRRRDPLWVLRSGWNQAARG